MFVLLQKEEDAWKDEVLKELVSVAEGLEVTLVFLSYKRLARGPQSCPTTYLRVLSYCKC